MPADVAHVYTGKVSIEPVFFSDPEVPRGWYHVSNANVGTHAPCSVAMTREGLPAGDRLDPGSAIDVMGPGVWVVGPTHGTPAIICVERRMVPSYRSVSPMGERHGIASWKSVAMGVKLTPGTWHPIVTNVVGMVGGVVRVTGSGPAWIGTHVRAQQPTPPTEADMAEYGGAFPIFPGEPPLALEGNPGLYAFAFADGVVLHFLKLGRGAYFVRPLP